MPIQKSIWLGAWADKTRLGERQLRSQKAERMKKIVVCSYEKAHGNCDDGKIVPYLGRHDATLDARARLSFNHKTRLFLHGYEGIIVRSIVAETQEFRDFKRRQTAEQKTHDNSENDFRHGPDPR